jgi:hypothetical protein
MTEVIDKLQRRCKKWTFDLRSMGVLVDIFACNVLGVPEKGFKKTNSLQASGGSASGFGFKNATSVWRFSLTGGLALDLYEGTLRRPVLSAPWLALCTVNLSRKESKAAGWDRSVLFELGSAKLEMPDNLLFQTVELMQDIPNKADILEVAAQGAQAANNQLTAALLRRRTIMWCNLEEFIVQIPIQQETVSVCLCEVQLLRPRAFFVTAGEEVGFHLALGSVEMRVSSSAGYSSQQAIPERLVLSLRDQAACEAQPGHFLQLQYSQFFGKRNDLTLDVSGIDFAWYPDEMEVICKYASDTLIALQRRLAASPEPKVHAPEIVRVQPRAVSLFGDEDNAPAAIKVPTRVKVSLFGDDDDAAMPVKVLTKATVAMSLFDEVAAPTKPPDPKLPQPSSADRVLDAANFARPTSTQSSHTPAGPVSDEAADGATKRGSLDDMLQERPIKNWSGVFQGMTLHVQVLQEWNGTLYSRAKSRSVSELCTMRFGGISIHDAEITREGTLRVTGGEFRFFELRDLTATGSVHPIIAEVSGHGVSSRFDIATFNKQDDGFPGYQLGIAVQVEASNSHADVHHTSTKHALGLVYVHRFVEQLKVYLRTDILSVVDPLLQAVSEGQDVRSLPVQPAEQYMIHYDIKLTHPVVHVPRSSVSRQDIQLDLGHLSASNSFGLGDSGKVEERWQISLSQMNATTSGLAYSPVLARYSLSELAALLTADFLLDQFDGLRREAPKRLYAGAQYGEKTDDEKSEDTIDEQKHAWAMQVREKAQEAAALDLTTLEELMDSAAIAQVIVRNRPTETVGIRPVDYTHLAPEAKARSVLVGAIETLLGPQILLEPCTAMVSIVMVDSQMKTRIDIEDCIALRMNDIQYEHLVGSYSDNYCEWHKDHPWAAGAADGDLKGDDLAEMLRLAFERVWDRPIAPRSVEIEFKLHVESLQCICTFFNPTQNPANKRRDLVTISATKIVYWLNSYSPVHELHMTTDQIRDLLLDYGVSHGCEDHAALAALLLPYEKLRAAEMAGHVSVGSLDVVNNRSDCCGGIPMSIMCAERSDVSAEKGTFITVKQIHSFGRHKGFFVTVDRSKVVLDWGLFQRLISFSMAGIGAMSLVPAGTLSDIQCMLDGIVGLGNEGGLGDGSEHPQLLTYIRTAAGGTVSELQCETMVCECLPDFSRDVATEAVDLELCAIYEVWMLSDVMKQTATLSKVSLRPIFLKADLEKVPAQGDAAIIPFMHIKFEMVTKDGRPRSEIDIFEPDVQV